MNKTDIITRAANTKKPMKADIMATLQAMLNNGTRTISDEELAIFYSFFIPPIPAKAKTLEQWVAKAVAKKDVRQYLNYIYSDGARLIAADGHRLHWIETTAYPEGLYIPGTMDKVALDARYPDIDRVIPKTYTADKTIISLAELPVIETKQGGLAYKLANGTHLMKKYLDTMANREKEVYVWIVENSVFEAVYLESIDGQHKAVIMPIRVTTE